MDIRIALAGNPNCGKTTLFNALTGSNQFVGNWPGVTVEKKEGKLKKHDGVKICDLPGIYSLSPYTLEEVVARNYLINERPDAILNIVDGTNLERNLYLTTQLVELGIPVIVAINMMDIVRKNDDKINIPELSRSLGCKIVEISALKSEGVMEAAELAIEAVKNTKTVPQHTFSGPVEHSIAHIEEAVLHDMPENMQRWYAIKIFERDEKILEQLNIPSDKLEHIESDIQKAERELDDDAESIITNERYVYIASIMKGSYKKAGAGKLSVSDKIDKVVTNRWLALPIFALVMCLVYYIAVSTVGTIFTDWANDGVFGEGWYFLGIGDSAYQKECDDFAEQKIWTEDFRNKLEEAVSEGVLGASEIQKAVDGGSYKDFAEQMDIYAENVSEAGFDIALLFDNAIGENGENLPSPSDYGWWIPGIPAILGKWLANANEGVASLIIDGIVGGVGAVLGFVPQMLVLFIFLAFLEACGYMSRIAFVMDRVFRKFGLSGKSFIPMLIGTGCGVPGIMASRTIENDRDRKMTIMTTTFIPCGAKLPVISLIATALFGGAWWVAPSAYFIGITAVVVSGIILKKFKMFSGEPAPFVMELPAYHMPTFGNVMRSMWERGWSFIKKAGTIILLASIVVWLASNFGIRADGTFGFGLDLEIDDTILGFIGKCLKWIFIPLGFSDVTATIATLMGLVAKEEIVGVFGVLNLASMTQISAYSFLVFNLLCAPCFAAIGAIKREMNNAKWTWFAIGYQCSFAYVISMIIYQFGTMFSNNGRSVGHIVGFIVAVALLLTLCYLLFRPAKKEADVVEKA